MDNNLQVVTSKKSRPLVSILIGLGLSVVLTMVFGLVVMLAFIFFTGFKVASGNLEPYLVASPIYLIFSILVTLPSLIVSSYISTAYVPRREHKYALIIALLLITVSIYFWLQSGSFQKYPLWYSIFSFVVPIPCFFIGAKLRAKKLTSR